MVGRALVIALGLVVAVGVAGCAPAPVAEPAAAPPRTVNSTPASTSIDPITGSLITRVRPYDAPAGLGIELWTQRSKLSESATSSLSYAIKTMTTTGTMQVASPRAEFRVVTSTGTIELTPREGAQNGPSAISGFGGMGEVASLPPGTLGVIAIVHMGPTLEAARKGTRIAVNLNDIPVVEKPQRLYPFGHSNSF